MATANRVSNISSDLAVRDYDSWIILGYAAFAVFAIAAICFAAEGPGIAADDLLAMARMP